MIYCVEDDAGIRNMMVYTLNASGLEAKGLPEGSALFAELEYADALPRLIMLDIMLPGDDGITILKKLKASERTKNIPVIMATALSGEYDKVSGLDLGADDYLGKPFGMMEMVARVKAVLRRSGASEKQALLLGPIRMDLSSYKAFVNDKELTLTRKEFNLLKTFLENPGRAFTREYLLSAVWGVEFDAETRTVDAHIKSLREKLGDAAGMIETIRGVGYRMVEK